MSKVFSRVFVLRHTWRAKKANPQDPEALTPTGALIAYLMGEYISQHFEPDFFEGEKRCSDRPRGVRSALTMWAGMHDGVPANEKFMAEERLTDWSNDPTPLIQRTLGRVKTFAKANQVNPGEAIFMMMDDGDKEVLEAHALKTSRILEVIDDIAQLQLPGDHFVGGLHEAGIDGAFLQCAEGEVSYKGLMANGGLFERNEGFVASFGSGGNFLHVEQIRLPSDMKALIESMKQTESLDSLSKWADKMNPELLKKEDKESV